MDNFLDKKITKILANVTEALDMTLAETKLFYKQSINPHSINIVTKRKKMETKAINENKQLTFIFRSFLSDTAYDVVYFFLKNSETLEEYTDFFKIKEGVNKINRKYELTSSVWNGSEGTLTIEWEFFDKDKNPIPNCTISFQVLECGI